MATLTAPLRVRLEPELKVRLQAIAASKKRTLSNLVLWILDDYSKREFAAAKAGKKNAKEPLRPHSGKN